MIANNIELRKQREKNVISSLEKEIEEEEMILSIISISNYEQLLADWDSRQEDSVLNIKEAKI